MNLGSMRHAIILGVFCLGFGILMAVTKSLAAADIEARAQEDRLNSLSQVLPKELYDNNPLEAIVKLSHEGKEVTIYRAMKGGKVVGMAYEIEGSGYAGEIKLMLGIDAEGRVLGVRALAHKETPGLGDKIEVKKGDWILRFTGLSLGNPVEEKWKVKKDGGEFDQFAGATITPRGVVKAIKHGLDFFAENKAKLTEAN